MGLAVPEPAPATVHAGAGRNCRHRQGLRHRLLNLEGSSAYPESRQARLPGRHGHWANLFVSGDVPDPAYPQVPNGIRDDEFSTDSFVGKCLEFLVLDLDSPYFQLVPCCECIVR